MNNGSIPARPPPGMPSNNNGTNQRSNYMNVHNPSSQASSNVYNEGGPRDASMMSGYSKSGAPPIARGVHGYTSGISQPMAQSSTFAPGSEASPEMIAMMMSKASIGPSGPDVPLTATEANFNVNEHDFPTLGGMPPSMNMAPPGVYGAAVNRTEEADKEFAMAPEDFPALPGAKQAQKSSKTPEDINTNNSAQESNPTEGADPYGMLYFLNVLDRKSIDLTTLALGIDLMAMGMALNEKPDVYPDFHSPWDDEMKSSSRMPKIEEIPECYKNSPNPESINLKELKEETLFYIFYDMPQDQLQLSSAQELYNKGWVYHKERQLWFTGATVAEGAGTTPGVKYTYFDIKNWQRRVFTINTPGGIEAGFMTLNELKRYT